MEEQRPGKLNPLVNNSVSSDFSTQSYFHQMKKSLPTNNADMVSNPSESGVNSQNTLNVLEDVFTPKSK